MGTQLHQSFGKWSTKGWRIHPYGLDHQMAKGVHKPPLPRYRPEPRSQMEISVSRKRFLTRQISRAKLPNWTFSRFETTCCPPPPWTGHGGAPTGQAISEEFV